MKQRDLTIYTKRFIIIIFLTYLSIFHAYQENSLANEDFTVRTNCFVSSFKRKLARIIKHTNTKEINFYNQDLKDCPSPIATCAAVFSKSLSSIPELSNYACLYIYIYKLLGLYVLLRKKTTCSTSANQLQSEFKKQKIEK